MIITRFPSTAACRMTSAMQFPPDRQEDYCFRLRLEGLRANKITSEIQNSSNVTIMCKSWMLSGESRCTTFALQLASSCCHRDIFQSAQFVAGVHNLCPPPWRSSSQWHCNTRLSICWIHNRQIYAAKWQNTTLMRLLRWADRQREINIIVIYNLEAENFVVCLFCDMRFQTQVHWI